MSIARGADPFEGMDDLGRELVKFPASFMEPVYIGDPPHISTSADCALGTATLITIEGRYFAVTCEHVLAEVDRRRDSGMTDFFQLGAITFDPLPQVSDRDADLDLAVIELRADQVGEDVDSRSTLTRSRFHSPGKWPTDEVTEGDVISFAGFPGNLKRQESEAHFTLYKMSHGATPVHSAGEGYFWTRIEPEKCVGWALDGVDVQEVGGLSGGPVFRWRQGQFNADLVGFITEYNKPLDLLYIRSSRHLKTDGAIAR